MIMGGDGGGMPSILQAAVQMKSAQLAEMRPDWEAAPPFMRHTEQIGVEEVAQARGMDFEGSLAAAERWKGAGNDAFKAGEIEPAIEEYERAISVFTYFERDEAGVKGGKPGEVVELVHTHAPGSVCEEDADRRGAFLASVYANVAACLLKFDDPENRLAAQVVYACDRCLAEQVPCISDGSDEELGTHAAAISAQQIRVKALFRRAQARLRNDTVADLELAVADLTKASRLDNEVCRRSGGGLKANKEVHRLLAKQKKLLSAQNAKDGKTFSGMFGRGVVITEEEERDIHQQAHEDNVANMKARIEAGLPFV